MTTESTEPQRIVAEGEPMTDLLEQLDELLAKTRRELTPLNEFYAKLHVIESEACRRVGEPPPARPRVVLNPPDPPGSGGLDSPEEDAAEIFFLVRRMAENPPKPTHYLTNDEFWAEFEDQIGPYDPDDQTDVGPGWPTESR